MNSSWYNAHLENVRNLQKKDTGSKKKAMVIFAIILLIAVAAIAITGIINDDPNTITSAFIIALPGFMVILLVLLISNKKSGKDVTKALRQNLESLLTTPEQVAQFDYEMSATYLCDFEVDTAPSTHVIFTEHYIGIAGHDFYNLPSYHFARRSDICEMKFALTKNENKPHGLGVGYFVDLIGSDGKKCLGTTVLGKTV